MPRPPGNHDQAAFGRESLFRKKLNELRQSGNIAQTPQSDALHRTQELQKSTYLEKVHTTLANTDQGDLERWTMLDGLTELYNHNSIMRIIKDEVRRAKRYKYAVSIVMVTIDGFKEISGKYGHFASDSVLKGLANLVMECIRDVDVPARYDAETLIVACPQTDLPGASVVAERIRSKIATERISDVGQNWTVTVSVGVGAFPANAAKDEELIAVTKQAMLGAQQSGGNTVAFVTEA